MSKPKKPIAPHAQDKAFSDSQISYIVFVSDSLTIKTRDLKIGHFQNCRIAFRNINQRPDLLNDLNVQTKQKYLDLYFSNDCDVQNNIFFYFSTPIAIKCSVKTPSISSVNFVVFIMYVHGSI